MAANPIRVVPGIYRHYKGQLYLALGTVVWHDGFGENKPRQYVCYVCLYENNLESKRAEQCIRPVEEWVSKVELPGGAKQDRYTLITELGP